MMGVCLRWLLSFRQSYRISNVHSNITERIGHRHNSDEIEGVTFSLSFPYEYLRGNLSLSSFIGIALLIHAVLLPQYTKTIIYKQP